MPKYKQIYDSLLNRIIEGEFKAGETLPKEFDLMEEYNSSRDTVRKALKLLSDAGYIHAHKGVGSVVLDCNRFEFPVSGIESFKELHEKLGNDTHTKVICCELIDPDQRIKGILKLKDGEKVWMVERVRTINGESIILDLDFLNASIIPELTPQIAENSIYEYIEQTLNLNISYANKEFTCQNATENDKKLLDLKGFDLIVNVDSFSYLSDTRIFQFTRSRHRPDKFRFVTFAKR